MRGAAVVALDIVLAEVRKLTSRVHLGPSRRKEEQMRDTRTVDRR